MANETLGASFSIDVTDLKTGLSQANRLIKESQSEFQAAAAGMDDWTQSEEGLNAKIKSLNQITEIQRKKVDALQSEYDNLITNGLDPTSKEAVELRTKINNETTALNKNEAELKKQSKALEELENDTEDVGESLDDMSDDAEEAGDAVEEMGDKFGGLKAAGGVAVKAIAAVGAACVAAVGSFLGLAESTRESRNEMAKLETSFQTAGLSAENAEQTFTELYGIMGDEGAAVEAAQQLAKISQNETDLAANTRILTGVMAEYGNSIPLEGLAEGIAASSAMSSVQGSLADALEWQGVNLDDYNAKLATLSTEEERAAYIQSTLTELYGASADAYAENNAAVIAANEAQANLNLALNELGAIAEPIMTTIKTLATDLLVSITPFVSLIGDGLAGALNGAAGASETLAEGLTGVIESLLDQIISMLPFVIDTIVAVVPQLLTALLGQLPTILQTVVDIILQVINAMTAMIPNILVEVTNTLGIIMTTIVENIPALLEAAIQFFTAIVEAVPEIIDILMLNLNELIIEVIWGLMDAIPDLLEAAVTLFTAIVDAIPLIITSLVENLSYIIETIIEGLTDALPMLLDAAITLLMAIVDAIPIIIDALIENLPLIIDAIINGVLDALPLLLDAAIKLLFALIDAIPVIVSELLKAMPKIIETILKSVRDALPKLFSTAKDLLGKIIDAVGDLVKKLPGNMGKIITAMINGLKEGISKIKGIGKDIVEGLWNGISDMASWIGNKVKGFGESVLGGIKDFFGIHSPSRVMSDQVGKNLALGIGEGFEKNIADVNKDITDAMNFDDPSHPTGGAPRRAGGLTVYQTNNYKQAYTSRFEQYKSKQQLAATARLMKAGAV